MVFHFALQQLSEIKDVESVKEKLLSLAQNVDFLKHFPVLNDLRLAGYGRVASPPTPLREVKSFGANPGDLRMFCYAPEQWQEPRALVVVLHGCGQTAAAYDLGAGWSTLAKHFGFALLLPEQQLSNNPNGCFNWFSPADVTRGRGEVASIRQMIAHMVRAHDIDQRRIFVTGLSAGGAMATAMLATYPETFTAGAVIAGLPYGIASTLREAIDGMFHAGNRSPRELGDLVRHASAHRGPWPKLSVWHGSADRIVNPSNADEIVKQWADLHDVAIEPMAETVVDGHPRQVWWGGDGETVIESYSITDMAHGTPIGIAANDERYGLEGAFLIEAGISSSYHIAGFFGLTRWIGQAAEPAPAHEIVVPTAVAAEAARPKASPSRRRRRSGLDVGKIISRALTAAGLKR